jgi:hypothetical protein
MPTALIKRRIGEVLNRHNPPAENIIIYSLGRAEELASVIPGLDEMPPLNTPEGHEWVMRLVDLLEPDGILFDNLMSLAPGDHSDGETWRNTEPLVMRLSRAGIAQIWLDHTGWNTDRQYGTSTKAWKFDAVGVMKPLPETERVEREVGFTLSFEPPGKCRRRTPENWRDFQTRTIRLAAGEWRAEAADKASKPLTKEGEGWYRDLVNMFAVEGLPQKSEPIDWRRCTSRHIRPSGAASPDRMPDAMLTGTAEARNGGA